MTIITEKIPVKGGADFTFVCSRIPFAVTCTNNLPHGANNLIDLDLVNKMNIPLENIKVTRMSLQGRDVRAVGKVRQTVQCVLKGKIHGTVHFEAKVVRDLYTMFNVDCIASKKTYFKLVGNKPPDPEEDEDEDKENIHYGNLDDPYEDEMKDPEIEAVKKEEVKKKKKNVKEKEDRHHHQKDLIPVEPDPPDAEPLPTLPEDVEEDGDSDDPEEEDADEYGAAAMYGYGSPPRSRAPDVLDPSMRNRPLDEYAAEHGHYYLPPLWEVMDLSDKVFCKVCYMAKQKREVFYSHYTLDLSCPSLSDVDKRILMARAMSGDL